MPCTSRLHTFPSSLTEVNSSKDHPATYWVILVRCADIRITPSTLSAHTWILCAVTHPESCPGPPFTPRGAWGGHDNQPTLSSFNPQPAVKVDWCVHHCPFSNAPYRMHAPECTHILHMCYETIPGVKTGHPGPRARSGEIPIPDILLPSQAFHGVFIAPHEQSDVCFEVCLTMAERFRFVLGACTKK